MKRILVFAFLVFGVVLAKAEEKDPLFAPFVGLLSLPKDWDGKLIISSGFLVEGSKSSFLFLSANDAKFNFVENAVLLDAADTFQGRFQKYLGELNGQYVKVCGHFSAYEESSPTRGIIRVIAVVPGLGSFDASIFKASQKEIESAP